MASGYAAVNGMKIYYEIEGSGQPLILLHGGLGSTETSSAIRPALSENRQVITIDLQGHGRTADIDRPMSDEAMADDVAGVMKTLEMETADVMGYSLGGGVAVRMAIQHPQAVRKLVAVSVACKQDGLYPEVVASMKQINAAAAEMMKPSPLYEIYSRVAPRVEDWPRLVTKMGELLQQNYDWSVEVTGISAPTLLVYADWDAVRPAHMVEFFGLLGGGKNDGGWDGSGMGKARLAVLPGSTHYDMFQSPALAPAVLPFLDEPMK